ncbi:MAG: preprotein translocase subunit SecG [Methyloglobulus sp.]|nr:preprotein translocase subunit SecG [Methyloglobulus sp.]
MYQVIIVIHILLGLSIIGLILMQQGKGADAGAGFGGGASGSVFGAQGAASFLSRSTAIMATLFFITSLGLAWLNGNKSGAAADFMNSSVPAVEKEALDLGLPNVDGANNQPVVPSAAPESKADVATPTLPAVVEQPAATVTVSPTPVEPASPVVEVPKAADVPAVEEKETELKPEPPVKHKKSAKKK